MTTPIRITIDLNDLAWEPLWPTQRQDVAAALAIIERHQAASDNGLQLLDDWGETDPNTLWIKRPAWLQERGCYYQHRYGDQAPQVMPRVLTVLRPESHRVADTQAEPTGQVPILH